VCDLKPIFTVRDLLWLVLITALPFLAAMPSAVLAEDGKTRFLRPFPRVMYGEAQAKELSLSPSPLMSRH
jgi:hypothetical protein